MLSLHPWVVRPFLSMLYSDPFFFFFFSSCIFSSVIFILLYWYISKGNIPMEGYTGAFHCNQSAKIIVTYIKIYMYVCVQTPIIQCPFIHSKGSINPRAWVTPPQRWLGTAPSVLPHLTAALCPHNRMGNFPQPSSASRSVL